MKEKRIVSAKNSDFQMVKKAKDDEDFSSSASTLSDEPSDMSSDEPSEKQAVKCVKQAPFAKAGAGVKGSENESNDDSETDSSGGDFSSVDTSSEQEEMNTTLQKKVEAAKAEYLTADSGAKTTPKTATKQQNQQQS